MQNEEPNKMTFQEFLGKLSILGILIAVYVALRVVVEYGFGYKNFPFLLCAFAISILIEAIRLKNKLKSQESTKPFFTRYNCNI